MQIKARFFKILVTLLGVVVMLDFIRCSKPKMDNSGRTTPSVPTVYPIQVWTTSADRNFLLQSKSIGFAQGQDVRFPTVIYVDSTRKFQTIDGFGYSLTGGSATLINQLPAVNRDSLLQELFGNKANSIGISYLRISLGASDLSASVFSYDDLPAGQMDLSLSKFSLANDTVDLIPVLKQILTINPNLKILASPWSPPTWMKTNQSSVGGSLQPQYFDVYAQYFVKYIQQMKANGIPIDAITLQNEPHHGGNNPSMLLTEGQAVEFVKTNLGPAFKSNNIKTKIIVWDHNCDEPNYPITVLNDVVAKSFINGSAFHLYAGDVSALSQVHNAHPDRDLYFTEQWTGSKGDFSGDLKWHLKNVIIGTMRNWSRVALEWNLANDAAYNPYTPGGCSECKGALTIQNGSITRNVSYYIVGQASKFVPAGSVRIGSDIIGSLQTVAFITPEGKKVLVVLNEGKNLETFNINYNNKWITTSVAAETAATYVW